MGLLIQILRLFRIIPPYVRPGTLEDGTIDPDYARNVPINEQRRDVERALGYRTRPILGGTVFYHDDDY